MRVVRTVALIVLLVLGGINVANSAQQPGGVPPLPKAEDGLPVETGGGMDAKYAVAQGGFFLALIIVLGFYRRDFWLKVESLKSERSDLMMALQNAAVELRANTDATRQMSTKFDRFSERRFNNEGRR